MTKKIERPPFTADETGLDAALVAALRSIPRERRNAIIREAAIEKSTSAGRPKVDTRAYRVLNIAWKRFLASNPNLSPDKAAAEFYKKKHKLFESLGLRISKGRKRNGEMKWPDFDTLRHAIKKGTRSQWVVLIGYNAITKQWRPTFRLREEYEAEEYLRACALFALTDGLAGAPGIYATMSNRR